ncbi:MAG: uracil-DNA glycosylase [Chthonomonadales bacterium]
MPCLPGTDAAKRLEALFREAADCAACPHLEGARAVLSVLNGSLSPKVLFVAEAPGKRGADRTRIPMWGDASGAAFRRLLQQTGLLPGDVFITNAVLCNPRNARGCNRPPTLEEIRNCNPFLKRTVDLLDPPIVATVGAVALRAAALIEPHGLTLHEAAGTVVPWYGRLLVALYHPSPRVLNTHRTWDEQRKDWEALRYALEGGEALSFASSPSKGGSSERSFNPK